MPNANQDSKCPNCNDALLSDKRYCPNCGLAVGSHADRTAIDLYVQARINQELSVRLKDQSTLVREIGDKAEDVVWRRLKMVSWVVAIIGVSLTAWGVKSTEDAAKRIVEGARQRVDPLIRSVEDKVRGYEKRMQEYEGMLSKSGGVALAQVDSLKTSSQIALREIGDIRQRLNLQQKILNDTSSLLLEVKGQVVDLGKREVKAEKFTTTGSGPSFMAHGNLTCPTSADLLKGGWPVAYCTQGTPPILYQRTSTDLRPVSSLSAVGFQDVSLAPKPTCNAAKRGTFYVDKSGASTGDEPFLCIKRSGNTYEWVRLSINP